MTRWTTVFWDLDGTLIDPWEGISQSVRFALACLGQAPLDDAALARFIGPPLLESFRREFGWDAERCRRAVALYRVYFRRTGIYQQRLYPGIRDLVGRLAASGVRQVLATAKPTPFAEIILDGHQLTPHFAAVVGSQLDGTRSSKAEVLRAAAAAAPNLEAARAVMVGDTAEDVAAAHQVGMDSVAVQYGYGDWRAVAAARPTATAGSVAELAQRLADGISGDAGS